MVVQLVKEVGIAVLGVFLLQCVLAVQLLFFWFLEEHCEIPEHSIVFRFAFLLVLILVLILGRARVYASPQSGRHCRPLLRLSVHRLRSLDGSRSTAWRPGPAAKHASRP